MNALPHAFPENPQVLVPRDGRDTMVIIARVLWACFPCHDHMRAAWIGLSRQSGFYGSKLDQ